MKSKFDVNTSYDGNGSLQVIVDKPQTIRLYAAQSIDIDKACLIHEAYIKTSAVQGKVSLEMHCHFNGKGELFSRSLNQTLSGNQKWTKLRTEFFLKEDENPDKIKLNTVFEGSGTAWIDPIKLSAQELY